MTRLSPEARAVVAAVDRLTTQVRRLADTRQTPTDAQSTTPDDGPRLPPMDPVHILGIDPSTSEGMAVQQAPAADEEQLRTARRERLRNLLARADRGSLTPGEVAALRELTDAEQRDADTARAVARGNLRHVRMLYADLQEAHEKARQAEELQRIAHETSNRSEAERAAAVAELKRSENARDALRRRAERAEAALDRVRAVARDWGPTLLPHSEAHRLLTDLRRSLDEPTEA